MKLFAATTSVLAMATPLVLSNPLLPPPGYGGSKPGGLEDASLIQERRVAKSLNSNLQDALLQQINPPPGWSGKIKVLDCKNQIVAGTNYFCKIKLAHINNEFYHVRVYQGFDRKYSLDGFENGHDKHDEIVYFGANVEDHYPYDFEDNNENLAGGLSNASNEQEIDLEDALNFNNALNNALLQEVNPPPGWSGDFEVLDCKAQVVAGTNFFCKVKMFENSEDTFHVRIYQSLFDDSYEIHGVEENHDDFDAIRYF